MTRSAFAAALIFALTALTVLSQSGPARLPVDAPTPAKLPARLSAAGPGTDVAEAPTGYNLITNGHTDQKTFLANMAQFSEDAVEIETDDQEGNLGPSYNSTACVRCHSNPVTGAESQIFELRVGHWDGTTFTAPAGGTLVRQRATHPEAQARVPDGFEIRARRRSTSLYGLAYIEFVRDSDLIALQASQPADMRGTLILSTVTTGVNPDGTFTTATRIGRFGWKCQHGSLLDFAADALRNEIGRTSPIVPTKAPAMDGRPLTQFVHNLGIDDPATPDKPFGSDVQSYTSFMRSLTAPPRDFSLQGTPDVVAGERLFAVCQCQQCHTPALTTAPVGAAINGFSSVPPAIGGRTVRMYGDCMTHNLGDGGDGIVQGNAPRNEMRTAFLAGIRSRPELFHDGLTYTIADAIQRHGGQGTRSRTLFNGLTPDQQRQVIVFVSSL